MTSLAAVLAVALLQDAPEVEVLFAPSGDALRLQARIAGELRTSRRSIDVAMFHFTSERLARALAERRRAGVAVRVLLDATQADADFVRRLRTDGIDVRRAFPPDGARFHHKFAVLDEGTVITGSYNWTYRADAANHENLLLLRDVRSAAAYRAEFERRWNDPDLSRP